MFKEKDQSKSFDQFTNLYELSKTLRFELRPVGKTKEILKEQRVFQKDRRILENYQIAKKYFDKLHKKFVQDSLKDVELDFEDYKKAYFAYSKKKKDQRKNEFKELDKQEKNLRKQIVNLFDNCAKKWKEEYNRKGAKIKKDKLGMLFEKEILDILRLRFAASKYPDVEYTDENGNKKNIFDSFKGFSTYFTNFHHSRKNFYKDDGTASAIPTRIINDNLRKFIENYDLYSHAKNDIDFNKEEKEIFELGYYNRCFLQNGIDGYNKIIGDINSKINKYRQDSKKKMPFFKILFKQILEDTGKQETEQDSFIEIENDEKVFNILEKFITHNEKNNKEFKKIFKNFINNNDYDLDKIYLAGRFVNQISNKWFKGWELFGSLLVEKGKRKPADFIPFSKIKDKLEKMETKNEDLFKDDIYKKYKNKNLSAYQVFMEIWTDEFRACFDECAKTMNDAKDMINKDEVYTNKKEKRDDIEIEIQKEKIKNYADSALAIYQMMKYFLLEKGRKSVDLAETEDKFYNDYNVVMNDAKTWLYFNEFRNYLTKKPFNEDKIKLNFENGTLLNGWDKNKEPENYGIILKKNKKYYLGLMLKKSNKIFSEKFKDEIKKDLNSGIYEKMNYKFMADPKKDFPKGCFSKKGRAIYKPDDDVVKIYENELFKKNNENFSLKSLHKIIDFYKSCLPLHPSWKEFDFCNIRETEEYKDNIGEFYKDVEKNSWKIWLEKVSEKYVNEKVENGELYLFEIYNKDFSEKRTGRKNLHTIYFENIFSEENSKNPVIKLNGQAEIFFRERTKNLESKNIVTKINKIEIKKNSENIVHNKRYMEDKILFHCPIKLNFAKDDNKINLRVNRLVSGNKDINIIGIDRGEKHLAYYSVIDQKGKIIETDSLNKVNGIDYLKLLDKKEKNINKQQKSWQAIENIKELKNGYISQVIKKICDLAIKYNAVIVFEDLNSGFKRGRQKIKKQVYQKLELALVNKLNYLVYKKENNKNNAGHYFKAYQLAPKVDNFKDIGKQTGIIFYTQAGYTSTTCPECGFRKNLYLKYKNIENSRKVFEDLEIFYDAEKKCIGVKYDPYNLKPRSFADFKYAKDKYTFYIEGERLRWNNQKKAVELYNIDELTRELFKDNNIDVSKNITEQIREQDFDAGFYKSFIFYINLALQLRNSDTEKDIDYLICPACGFHSKNGFQGNKYNADANGAYNIARKGIMILDKINKYKNEKDDLSKLKWGDLVVRNEEWDEFVQK